jgi:hypothetical protein
MTHFKFGRKYYKITNYDEACKLHRDGFISVEDYFEYCRENEFSSGYYSPTGTQGTSGTQGNQGYNPQEQLKTIKKYHFKGRYPKPR